MSTAGDPQAERERKRAKRAAAAQQQKEIEQLQQAEELARRKAEAPPCVFGEDCRVRGTETYGCSVPGCKAAGPAHHVCAAALGGPKATGGTNASREYAFACGAPGCPERQTTADEEREAKDDEGEREGEDVQAQREGAEVSSSLTPLKLTQVCAHRAVRARVCSSLFALYVELRTR